MSVCKGQKYRHFKGDIVEIIELAINSETLEEMVVYIHKSKIWVRPLTMFLSEVDHEKYPDVEQKYRFELIDND